MILYEYYLEGYNNTSLQFGYVPEFNGLETINAYCLGCVDGRNGIMKTILEFEKC